MTGSSFSAQVSVRQYTAGIHALAALNHRQWTHWQAFVLPYLPARAPNQAALQEILPMNAQTTIDLARRITGGFAYDPSVQSLLDRKQEQFDGWVRHARANYTVMQERWQQLCRTPFLFMTPSEQRPDYDEAHEDFRIIAEAGGLILPDPPLVTPLSTGQIRRARMGHSLGQHQRYLISERPWSFVCVGCHRNITVNHP